MNGHAAKTGISPVTAAKITDACTQKRYVIHINAQRATRKLTRNVGVVVFEGGDTEKPNAMRTIMRPWRSAPLLSHEQGCHVFLLFRKVAEGKACQQAVCLKSELKLRQSA